MILKMSVLLTVILLLLLNFEFSSPATAAATDSNGYIFYCPCMGRFGNQAEQFLGTLHFAKHLNRTLVLPPFIEYDSHQINFIPFDDYFQVQSLSQYHRVITMERFMSELAPLVWKEADRSIACYSARSFGESKPDRDKKQSCNPFEGSPFKQFWNHVGVREFPDGSLYYEPLHTDYRFIEDWKLKYSQVKVLTFVGAPSSFPTNARAVRLQRFVEFSREIALKSKEFQASRGFLNKPYLAVHLRHGTDWFRACDLLNENPAMKQLFSSQQCFGGGDDDNNQQSIPYELCMPTTAQIIQDIQSSLHEYNSRNLEQNPIRHVYIATDFDDESLWRELKKNLTDITLIAPKITLGPEESQTNLKSIQEPGTRNHHQQHVPLLPRAHFMTDLYLLSHSDVFIGNCISSFSAFVSRYRRYSRNPRITRFFALHSSLVPVPDPENLQPHHQEL